MRFTTSIFLIFSVLGLYPSIADGKSLKFNEDAMCIPAGDPIWETLGVVGDVVDFVVKEKFTLGPAEIVPGCRIGFGYSSELTSLNPKEIAEKRVVTSITNCEFKMAGVSIQFAVLDLEGCLDGYQYVTSPKNICKAKKGSSGTGRYFFEGGFLRCDHKPKQP